MIDFRDFRPKRAGLFPKARRIEENFRIALADANDWIFRESIDVINLETTGLGDGAFEAYSIRVWYRTAVVKPSVSHED